MTDPARRSPRPAAASEGDSSNWIEEVTGVAVARSAPLVGGMSSIVTRHELADGRIVVSRHITNDEWLEREPHLIAAEATALRMLSGTDLGSPTVIATTPARLAMTFVPGAMVTAPDGLRDRAMALADVARRIHAVALPPDHDLPPWRSWAPTEPAPPAWGDHSLWAEAIQAFGDQPTPTCDQPVLLHRDLHPLNVLWDGDKAHVVDWVNACVGHPHAELGHCRWNLTVLAGLDCADAFLDAYLQGDDTYASYWDLAPAMSFLPGPVGGDGWRAVGRADLTPAVVIERTELFLRSALDRASSASGGQQGHDQAPSSR